MKKDNRGGKRKGSGRPKKEKTKVTRIPMSLYSHIVSIKENPTAKIRCTCVNQFFGYGGCGDDCQSKFE